MTLFALQQFCPMPCQHWMKCAYPALEFVLLQRSSVLALAQDKPIQESRHDTSRTEEIPA
jgi:hypothetical protein